MSERRLEAWGEADTATEPIRLRLMPDMLDSGALTLKMVDRDGAGVDGGSLLHFYMEEGKLHIRREEFVREGLPVNTHNRRVVVE